MERRLRSPAPYGAVSEPVLSDRGRMAEEGGGGEGRVVRGETGGGGASEDDVLLPSFQEIVSTVFPSSSPSAPSNASARRRPTYLDFSPRGRAATLRFGLSCLFGDLYGAYDDDGEEGDGSLRRFLSVLCSTLREFIPSLSSTPPSRGDRESIDLLDETCICLGGCLRTSRYARRKIAGGKDAGAGDVVTPAQIGELATSVHSSRARRHLASTVGYLLDDVSIWDCVTDPGTIDVTVLTTLPFDIFY